MAAPKMSGSVWQDKKTGKWKSLITLPPVDGKRRRRETTHPTRRDAEAAHKRALFDQLTRTEAPVSHQTLAEYGEWWLENAKRGTIRDGTLGDYRHRLESLVYPTFGDRDITSVTTEAVTEWRQGLRRRGLSAATTNGARTIFRQLMQHAVDVGRLERNPVAIVKASSRQIDDPSAVREPWSIDEANEALGALRDDPLECFVATCLFTGLRRGEVLGLKWADLDLAKLQFTVRRTLKLNRVYDNERWQNSLVFENPKTKASVRTLIIHDALVDILNRHRDRQREQAVAAGSRWLEGDLVFSTSIGTPVNPSNLRLRYIKTLSNHGIRFVRIHDLRHTFAYIALTGGLPLEAISQALGHTDVNVTKSIYAPMVPALNERVGIGVGDLLSVFKPGTGDPDLELRDLPGFVPSHN